MTAASVVLTPALASATPDDTTIEVPAPPTVETTTPITVETTEPDATTEPAVESTTTSPDSIPTSSIEPAPSSEPDAPVPTTPDEGLVEAAADVGIMAGPAVVSVEVSITDPTTGAPISTVNSSSGFYSLTVSYGCSVADCTGTTVFVAPTPLDPYYSAYRKETAYTFTPPFTPAPSVTGTLATGLTVHLGTVPLGTSGQFSIRYGFARGGNAVAGGSFFPTGSVIQPDVTITAENSDNSATDSTPPTATWQTQVPEPVLRVDTSTANTRTDLDVSVNLRNTNSGCVRLFNGVWSALPQWLCAREYTATIELPEKAVWVSGGTYSAATHSVSWSESGNTYAAASGLGAGAVPLVVRFPSSEYPTTEPGCVATETFNATFDVTYVNGVSKTASESRSLEVQNCAPFAKGTVVKDSTATTIAIPTSTTDVIGHWETRTSNQSNVPATATIVDTELDQPDMPVDYVRVTAGGPATIEYTLDDGTSGTVTLANNQYQYAPSGRRFAEVTATSAVLPPNNATPSGTTGTLFVVRFGFTVAHTATPGPRTNTFSASLSFPENPELPNPYVVGSSSRTITLQAPGAVVPRLTLFAGNPTTPTGTIPIVGSTVSWSIGGAITQAPNVSTIIPQYVFVAPPAWDITGVTWDTAPPAGYLQAFTTVTIAGQQRDAVVITWPGPVAVPSSGTHPGLPVARVSTVPTGGAPAGTANNVANFYFGDATHAQATFSPAPYTDANDVDGDGSTSDQFASFTRAASLDPTRAVEVTKEICRPTSGGCEWISEPGSPPVGVPPDATSITYRITIHNTGNAALTNVVLYDVLPYINDGRGSTVQEVLASVSGVSSGLTLAYSTSTNPATASWTAPLSGAQAIRATTPSLPAFESWSFTYVASLIGGSADQIACNSASVTAATFGTIEPAPVCATTQEADLRIATADRYPLQVDRPGMVPFVVTNGGGSLNASATVTLDVPANVDIIDVENDGWECEAPGTTGPVTVTCRAVDDEGISRPLVREVSETIVLTVQPSAIPGGGQICFDGDISGAVNDPDLSNNTVTTCSQVVAATATGIAVSKDDARTLVTPGDQHTYTIEVSSELVAESITAATLTDTLPDNLIFVSSEPAVTPTGQNPDGTGGTLSWDLSALSPVGVPNAVGDGVTGGSAPTATVTVTVSIATDATGTVTNVAAGTAPDPAGGADLGDDDDDVDTVQEAVVTLTKAASPSVVTAIGQEVTYTFEVSNDGNVPLIDVTIQDEMAGLSTILCDSGPLPITLPSGASETCSATYRAVATDFVAGAIENSGTAAGQPTIGGRVASEPATASVVAQASASLSIDKTARETSFSSSGTELHFDFAVTNTGNIPLDGLTVADQLPGTAPVVCVATALEPAESTTCSTTYTTTIADVDAGGVTNRATASAFTPGDAPVRSMPDGMTIAADRTASVALDKYAQETLFAAEGVTINYRFLATNTGNVTLSNVAVTDAFLGAGAVTCPSTMLLPGSSQTCTATYLTTAEDLDLGRIDNVAEVTATSSDPDAPTVTDSDTHRVLADQDAAISIDKSVTPNEALRADEVLTYTFVVSNTGNVTLTDVAVVDEFDGLSAIVCGPEAASLPAGESVECTATYTVTQDDIDGLDQLINSATAVGTTPGDEIIESTPDSAPVPPVMAPELTITKSADPVSFDAPGTGLEFMFEVTNRGNMTLSGLVVNDPLPGASAAVCDAVSLAPDAATTCRATYVTTQADIDNGGVVNTATAQAATAGGTVVTSNVATVEVDAVGTIAATFVKGAVESDYSAPGPVTFTFDIDNTGNTTMRAISIADDLADVSAVSCPETILTPQAPPLRCTATYTVTQADLDRGSILNSATLTAASIAGPLSVADEFELLAVQSPQLSIVKRALDADFDAPDTVLDYEIVVTNTGNVTIDGITVVDDLAGADVTCPADTDLAPGDPALVCTATYTTTQADVDGGGVDNTATASGTTPGDDPISRQSDVVTVPAVQAPSIELSKSSDLAEGQFDAAGQPVTFTFDVTNTGNVTLTAIGVTDDWTGVSAVGCDATELAPTESTVCSATYTTAQADVDDGGFTNTATVDAVTLYDEPVSATASLALTSVRTPGATFTKAASASEYDEAGDEVTFSFTVTNTGNVTLSDIAIVDDLDGVSDVTCPATELAPGDEPLECTATYIVTQDDLDRGYLENLAHLTAATPDGTSPASVELEARAALNGSQSAAIALTKSAAESSFAAAGETLHYTFTVTNTGNVSLSEVTVEDPLPGLSAIDCPEAVLAPDISMDCTATYVTTQADLDAGAVVNTAVATGTPPPPPTPAVSGFRSVQQAAPPVVASAEATVTVPAVQEPAVELAKEVQETVFSAGTTLHYTFEVTNIGNITITDLSIDDQMAGLSPVSCTASSLAPGDSTTCSATYVATAADVTAGNITNTATVLAATASTANPAVSDTASVAVSAAASPSTTVLAPSTTVPPPPGSLPATGSSAVSATVIAAAALVACGVFAVLWSRRRGYR